ncbi:MAG: hypothetical protein AAF639_30210, partial [Chloroflexota bacterium]
PLFFVILLMVIPFTRTLRVLELVVSAFLICLMTFYYIDYVQMSVRQLHSYGLISESVLANINQRLSSYANFIWQTLNSLPLRKNTIFQPTNTPIYILCLGIGLRWGIGRYVTDIRMKRLAREYWLLLTTVIILILTISQLTGYNFYLITGISLLLAVLGVIIGGVFRDVAKGVFKLFLMFGRVIRVGWMKFVLILTYLVKFSRSLVKIVKRFYERVTQPLRELYHKIMDSLEQIESNTRRELGEIRSDD